MLCWLLYSFSLRLKLFFPSRFIALFAVECLLSLIVLLAIECLLSRFVCHRMLSSISCLLLLICLLSIVSWLFLIVLFAVYCLSFSDRVMSVVAGWQLPFSGSLSSCTRSSGVTPQDVSFIAVCFCLCFFFVSSLRLPFVARACMQCNHKKRDLTASPLRCLFSCLWRRMPPLVRFRMLVYTPHSIACMKHRTASSYTYTQMVAQPYHTIYIKGVVLQCILFVICTWPLGHSNTSYISNHLQIHVNT